MAGKTLIKAKKAAVISKHQKSSKDTGSTEVQVALITGRIKELTDHFRTHKKDHSGRRGLLKLVGQRKRLLTFLRTKDAGRYSALIQALDLRK